MWLPIYYFNRSVYDHIHIYQYACMYDSVNGLNDTYTSIHMYDYTHAYIYMCMYDSIYDIHIHIHVCGYIWLYKHVSISMYDSVYNLNDAFISIYIWLPICHFNASTSMISWLSICAYVRLGICLNHTYIQIYTCRLPIHQLLEVHITYRHMYDSVYGPNDTYTYIYIHIDIIIPIYHFNTSTSKLSICAS